MELTSHLPDADRRRVEDRLRHNLIAWLTTVRADGQPASVPVWFLLRDDGSILLYSKAGQAKLRHLAANPRVSLTLDGTDIGRDIVGVEGTARQVDDLPPAHQEPTYLAKYLERMQANFGSSEAFGELFTVPIVITPTKLRA